MNKMPAGMHPDIIGASFAQGIVQSFAPSGSTVRRFSAYARLLCNGYLVSENLEKAAVHLSGLGTVDDDAAKKLYTVEIPQFIRSCYEEAYANSEMDFSGCMASRYSVQSDILYQKICDIVNRDTFDDDKLKQLLNVVYAANLRHQLNPIIDGRSVVDLVHRFVQDQTCKPFYNFVHRMEVISVNEDAQQLKRTIKGRQQIVLQNLNPQEIVLCQSLNYFVDLPDQEIIARAFRMVTCTINHIPIVQYLNMHENTQYTSAEQLLTVRHVSDSVGGTTNTELLFRFNLYPGMVGETVNIYYECCLVTPFIKNISCNYSFSLLYPCKFLEHEFALDAKTKEKWGVQVKLFTPMTTSACTSENPDETTVLSGGTSDLKRITFYDWAMSGTGYWRNIYELKYANGKS
ncbi:hypothetical protein [Caproiciproducens faecalis]|uniref:Uncharacterized protein n=1 Tax=Caproiciproducens faecalis TaxID=2820301 RepID=A0ABS7DJT7_9FIRM|nr:hypothetical protein [Caproiciproducens faecalis]MBW7571558.1 hypothetical protein [Caproiciproducens faecalis]